MDTRSGTVALITGVSSGIGEGIAKMLAAEGVKAALVARRHHELERVAQAIRNLGGTALTAPADLRDEQALRVVIEQRRTRLGPIDMLVNSGGIVETTPIHETDMRAWDACLQVNLRAPTLLCALVLPDMRERKRGFIVNIASEAGAFFYGGMGAYAISKHALRVLTELVQEENQEVGGKRVGSLSRLCGYANGGSMGPGCEPAPFSPGGGSDGRRALPADPRGECEDGARDSDSHDTQPSCTRLTALDLLERGQRPTGPSWRLA